MELDERLMSANPPESAPGPATEEDARLREVRQVLVRDVRRRYRRRLLLAAGTAMVVVGVGVVAVVSVGQSSRDARPRIMATAPEPVEGSGADAAVLPLPAPVLPPAPAPNVAAAPSVAPAPNVAPAPIAAPAPNAAPAASVSQAPPEPAAVEYHPPARLATVQPGDAKEKVFEVLAATVERRGGTLVRTEGLRLRATGRSPHHARVEVAEVRIADTRAGTLHWFLFGDDRLLGWGPAEQWAAIAARYQIDSSYRPEPPRSGGGAGD
jgi:hypothetical protein